MNEQELRDYFATAALTGLLTNPRGFIDCERLADYYYEIADAMLKERQRDEH